MVGFRRRGVGPAFTEGGAFSILGVFLLLSLSHPQAPLSCQESGWNAAVVLGLIQDARRVRQGMTRDSTLKAYSSSARGYVYFYLDREDTGERILVKTDQIALQVFWKAPDQFKQRIVGLRDRETLPTNIKYHLDHLVVVQDEFGDRIRIGDGDEVEAVHHPIAPGSEAIYDFLLADSITLELPSTSDTVRVYEIKVRPKDFEAPGFVGTVFIDRGEKSIVRMSFTFTPASYVDEYLDHISISLENGLWMGRHWLPFRQQLEIRREVPFLDFPAGSVIRGSFQVRDYEINPRLPDMLFAGPTITALPQPAREDFPFEEGLFAQLEEEGLAGFKPPPEMDEIRSMAISIARDRYLSGLNHTRFYLPSPTVSSALRFNRSEGLFVGGGISHTLLPNLGASAYGGFSFGRKRPGLAFGLSLGTQEVPIRIQAYLNRPRDLEPGPAMSGILNSLAAATFNDDFSDLFFSSGVLATGSFSAGGGNRLSVTARGEEHRSARDVVSSHPESSDFRPVLPIQEGSWASLQLQSTFRTSLPGLTLDAGGLFGRLEDQTFGSLSAGLELHRRWLHRGLDLRVDLQGHSLWGDPPIQAGYFLGGRLTVPGYSFRSRLGDRYWLLRSETSLALFHPYVRLRAFTAAAGIRLTSFNSSEDTSTPWALPQTGGGSSHLLSAGLGLGLGWDVLRLDVARGFREGGKWELILSVNPDFWSWL